MMAAVIVDAVPRSGRNGIELLIAKLHALIGHKCMQILGRLARLCLLNLLGVRSS